MESEPGKPREGIWTIDHEGKTLFASEAMASLLGTTVDELIGKPSFDYVYAEDMPGAQRLFELKSRGDMNPFEFRLRRSDGTPIWVTVQGTPMRDESGAFRGVIGTFRAVRNQSPDRSIKTNGMSADV